MSYQKVTGTLSQGGHPGSYNGQDAYNDMLVTNDLYNGKTGLSHKGSVRQSFCSDGYGLQRSADNFEGGCEIDEAISKGDLEGGDRMTAVRRLTPLECTRLQGFPDGWVDIEEYEANGKIRPATDSNKYKALGNSIATPFWFYLLRRISAQYERPATLGSLFDGIGGFPYCHEKCNGPGTAIWASEIEPFCIAVTKKHFGED